MGGHSLQEVWFEVTSDPINLGQVDQFYLINFSLLLDMGWHPTDKQAKFFQKEGVIDHGRSLGGPKASCLACRYFRR